MPAALRTEFTLPADARLLRLVQDYGRTLAGLADFPADQVEALTLALGEAFSNCLKHAFDEDESGNVTLVGELTPAALMLAVHDRGLPFDQSLDPAAAPPDPAKPAPDRRGGRGLSLIHRCADEVRWLNHGPAGKELRLTKYRSGLCRLEPPPAHAASAYHEPTPQGVTQDYTIRLLRPEDAIRLAQLMYHVYGYSYSNEDFYYPERLAHDLETGTHVGVVAVTDNGEIAGHVGVWRPHRGPLAELGQLAVAPAHRGQGLRQRMGDRLQEEIRRLGLIGLYAEAVTIHPISQEASDSRGLHVCGLQLLDWQAHFKSLRTIPGGLAYPDAALGPAPQRESMVFYFRHLTPPAPTAVCAPSRHRAMLARIYANLGAPVEFLPPGGPTGLGQIAVHYDRETNAGGIEVNRIGIDTLPEIAQARRDLCDLAGAAVVSLHLPLAQGGTPWLCEAAQADGFFFSGVRPRFAPDGDFLRLQYLNADLDLKRIHLASPFARELLAYVLAEKARINSLSDSPGQ
jgi:anti-sigma regulatory factor (Ser/Thr protein kinase)/GNAT superfamily N-acetyltransferase